MTGLSDSTKGLAKGHVVISGPWDGLVEHLGREFEPRLSLAISGRIDCSFFCFIPAV